MKLTKSAARRLVQDDERMGEIIQAESRDLANSGDFAREIGMLWQDVREKFLRIGRLLARAKLILPHGEFDRMVTDELPFNPSIAYQLRAVAEAVDRGRITLDELPKAYSVAYQLTTLDDSGLDQAREAGLVRPDLRRVEIVEFKRALSRHGHVTDEVERLKEERRRLLERVGLIDAELARLGGERA